MASVDRDPAESDAEDVDVTGALLDALGDDVARDILRLGKQGVVTVEQLADHCAVSEATVYRRLRELHELGLVEKCNHFDAGVVTKGAYRTTMDGVTIRLTDDGITVETEPSDEFADAVRTVRNNVDLDEVTYDAHDHSVQVAFSLDEERFKTFLDSYR